MWNLTGTFIASFLINLAENKMRNYKWVFIIVIVGFIALSLIFTDGTVNVKVFDFEWKMLAPLNMLVYTGLGFLLAFLTRP